MDGLYDDRAWVYDAAFDGNAEEEVSWLVQRFGGTPRRLLEPGCGSGRLMLAFARRGIVVVGVDASKTMLARARRRVVQAGLPAPQLECADMACFDAGGTCDGAYCPINTFSYLTTEVLAARHLGCVAACLRPGSRYLVQLDLCSLDVYPFSLEASWDVETPEGPMHCSWRGRRFDAATKIEVQVSRFEFTAGPRAGQVYEDTHRMRMWSWADWTALVEASDFRQVAAYDGSRRPVKHGPAVEGCPLIWHELERR